MIHYTVKFSDDRNSIILLSDPLPCQPRYRLTYLKVGGEKINIRFEIAPPDQPDAFALYTEGVARHE